MHDKIQNDFFSAHIKYVSYRICNMYTYVCAVHIYQGKSRDISFIDIILQRAAHSKKKR